MRLFEIIADYIVDTKLIEMAVERKQIVSLCLSLSSQIVAHVVKVVWFNKSVDVNHWCNELNGWLHSIQDLKFNRKQRLSGDQYYKNIFTSVLEFGVSDLNDIVEKRIKVGAIDAKTKNELTDYQALQKVESILHNVCYDISNNKFIDIKNYLY